MENKINLVEILKDCPKGMELDCALFDVVKFEECAGDCIYICLNNGELFALTKYGSCIEFPISKCVIFPKGKTTWEGFVPPCKFKDGDVLFVDCSDDEEDKSYQYIFILNKPEFNGKWHSYCYLDGVGDFDSKETYLTDDEYHPRFATEEEKQKLFDAIKANGYKWNPETKTLEKLIVPKFKGGDKIVSKNKRDEYFHILHVAEHNYILNIKGYCLEFKDQDNFELVPDKFDVSTLKPFDKVLVRDNDEQMWTADMFSFYNEKHVYPFMCVGHYTNQCIPYDQNKHLLGTTNKCDDLYKTWE